MSNSAVTTGPLCWQIVDSIGSPSRVHHAGIVLGKYLYIHGGVEKPQNRQPTNSFLRFHLDNHIWEDLTTSQSPALSHHAAVTVNNRLVMFIGGWNGRERTSSVYVFHCDWLCWMPPCSTTGYPEGAGLSAHTITPLVDGWLIIGREGGLRTQRRSGNAFILRGDVKGDTLRVWDHRLLVNLCNGFLSTDLLEDKESLSRMTFKTAPLDVSSRSYHAALALGSRCLHVVGGRASGLLESHMMPGLTPAPVTPLITRLVAAAERRKRGSTSRPGGAAVVRRKSSDVALSSDVKRGDELCGLIPLNEAPHFKNKQSVLDPGGRRGHCLIAGEGGFLISGGETFDGRSKGPVDLAWLYCADRPGYFWAGSMNHSRAYGVVAVDATTQQVWYHGGVGPGNTVCNQVLQLVSSSAS